MQPSPSRTGRYLREFAMMEKLFRLRAKPKPMSERNDPTNPHFLPVEEDGDTRESTANAGASGDTAQLPGERERLETENTELREQLLRMRAEFDNFRRRVIREKEEIADHASMESTRAMLSIVDDFERALAVECADASYAKGVELIYVRLLDTLKKLGVDPIEADGQSFDPNLHHAIEMVKTNEVPDHMVLQTYQKGYLYKGKLLRPSVVKVAVEPDGESSESPMRDIN